ncbi:hypothetical protein P280DRAFT_514323 [Massarina eburnea CBS 473.64]|uniref:Uncharacterized protein n=1 Tax=Massarina eburnea CBS 473.64 TaxID=1395130 RepID=A0A6A6SCG4_9PLEO|nr:hypothetical protein P280DRAFT_514323 [Massarina eburnea CBS 473.64]
MIVRESPKKAKKPTQNWPPKSPHEALLASPSGRRRYEQRHDRKSVSPSPAKRRPMALSLGQSDRGSHGEDEDEDEETLQLQLQAIEARLKIKKLQKARQFADSNNDNSAISSQPSLTSSFRKPDLPRSHSERSHSERSQSEIQVPVSPMRNRRVQEEQKSPARVMMGIDKGLRAQDVSLKRPSSFSAKMQSAGITGRLSQSIPTRDPEAPRPKSFSERMTETREKEKERNEKQARIDQSRSRGFGLQNIEGLKDKPTPRAGSALSTGTGSFHGAGSGSFEGTGMRSFQGTGSGSFQGAGTRSFQGVGARSFQGTGTGSFQGTEFKSFPVPESRSFLGPESNLKKFDLPGRTRSNSDTASLGSPRPGSNQSQYSRSTAAATRPTSAFGTSNTASRYAEIASRDESTDAPSFDSFSGLHLKSREMQHNAIVRTLEGKTVVTIPKLLKTVKAPDYDPPDMENDYVVLGVIASKSSPMTPKNSIRDRSTSNQEADAHQSNKFMVIKLVDLKWELDLFLFDTGFSQFWKLSVGTLIAVLNPEIMPPRNRDGGKFSLKLTSSDDTVLEIGTARDLDFCHAMRKDGKECGTWIDGRKTEFCDFHIELQVEKNKRGRMEVNTMTGFGKGPSGTGKGGMFGGMFGGKGGPKGDELRREGKYHDRTLHETMFIAPGAGGAARLLDQDTQPWDRTARAERHRKQLADKEKERDLARRLGELGTGAGGEYMKHKGAGLEKPVKSQPPVQGPSSETSSTTDFLELLNRKAQNVSLGPTKRKRINSHKSAAPTEPLGWGGAFRRGLPFSPARKDNNISLQGTREPSPVKKKARLLLPEKGIREPGRDSVGAMDIGLIAAMDEDDDDLEVV